MGGKCISGHGQKDWGVFGALLLKHSVYLGLGCGPLPIRMLKP